MTQNHRCQFPPKLAWVHGIPSLSSLLSLPFYTLLTWVDCVQTADPPMFGPDHASKVVGPDEVVAKTIFVRTVFFPQKTFSPSVGQNWPKQ